MKNMRKKIISLLLVLVMTAMGTPALGSAVDTFGRLSLQSGFTSIMAGTIGDVTLLITNNSQELIPGPIPMSIGSANGVIATVIDVIDNIPAGYTKTVRVHVDGRNSTGFGTFPLPVTIGTQVFPTGIVVEVQPAAELPPPTPTPGPTPTPIGEAEIAMTAPRNYVTTRPGESVTVGITLQNNSRDNTITNLVLQPDMIVGFRNEFVRHSPAMIRPGESQTFLFIITPQPGTSPGDYVIPFSFTYRNVVGRTFTETKSVTVRILDGPAPFLIIDDFRTDLDVIRPGDTFNIYANITNIGVGAAEAVEITVTGADGPRGLSLVGSDTMVITSVGAGSSVVASFTMTAHTDIAPGAYPIAFNLSYTANGQDRSFRGSYFVNIGEGLGVQNRGRLELVSLDRTPGPKDAGDLASFYLVLVNRGEAPARNINVSLNNLSNHLTPMTPNIQLIPEILPGDAVELVFRVSPTSDSVTQTYMVGITVKYESGRRDNDGRFVVESFDLSTSVDVRREVTRLVIDSLISPAHQVGLGQSGTITMTLSNQSDITATNVRIEASWPSGMAPSSASVQTIRELGPGESQNLSFSFMPNSTAGTQTHMIGFTVEYDNGLERGRFVQYGSINVSVPEPTPTPPPGATPFISVPRIMLSEYRITSPNVENPSVVLAGQEFDMFLRIRNTHSELTVSNILVSLTVPETGTTGAQTGNVFSPVHGSNSFFIYEILPGQEYEITLRMFCLHNAQGRNYVMVLNFDYEDSVGRSHGASQEVGITVRQPARLELGPINFPSFMSVGETHFMSFYFRNVGFVTLRNLMITAEGEGFDGSRGVYIVGNFGIGAFEFYDGSITALEPGEHILQIVVTYDLDTGEHIRLVEEAVVTVMDGFGMDPFDDFMGGMMGGIRGRPGEGMVMMPGDMFGPGAGFEEGTEGGVIAVFSGWIRTGFDFANDNVWPWVAVGGLGALAVGISLARSAKRRKMYSLED